MRSYRARLIKRRRRTKAQIEQLDRQIIIALIAEQIDQYDLPTKPRKNGDKRSLHIAETVEAEAMPAHIMREILREKVELLLPPRALLVARAAEESERESIDLLARHLLRSNGGAP